MLSRLTTYLRERWHPLWRLRQSPAYRGFQRRFDCTVFTRLPETDLRVAIRLLRDASYLANAEILAPEIYRACALVLEAVQPAVFWDIGANIGRYSWFVVRHPSVRQVLMFEPDPTNFALITRTIRKNALEHCRVLNLALSDRCGESSFLVDRASGAGGSLEATAQRDNTHSLQHAYRLEEVIACQTATVDRLIADGLPAPDLLKIDVEGAERLVLAGAEACLERDRPALLLETADRELVRCIRARGYHAFRIGAGDTLFIPTGRALDLTALRRAFPPDDGAA